MGLGFKEFREFREFKEFREASKTNSWGWDLGNLGNSLKPTHLRNEGLVFGGGGG